MNKKSSLSYTTMNNAMLEPHTYLNKLMGLKTYQTQAMAEGDIAHGITQRHVSGVEQHPILTAKKLPTFELVERWKWDEQMRVRFDINEKYYFTGFLDADDPGRGDIGEFKFGVVWSLGKFARLIQWQLYALGRPEHKKTWFVNAPRDPKTWNEANVFVYNMDITADHRQAASEWIKKALTTIDNIKEETDRAEALKKEKGITGRSRFCYYIGCGFCKE